jgi:recombination protein RecA
MSASSVFSSPAMGRPFIFSPPSSLHSSAGKAAEILAQIGAIPRLAAVVPASRLDVCPPPEMVSSGIPQLDSLTGGLARGCLTEICGTASSGRTSVLLFALARATQRGEICALVDASDAFDPASAAAAGMEMSRLLWVRCGEKYPSHKPPPAALTGGKKTGSSYQGSYQGMPSGIPRSLREGHDFSRAVSHEQLSRWRNPETKHWESQLGQMLKVTDLLLQSNGFGMIALDLGDVPEQSARRIPLASWFRFRRAVERTPTVLLVLEQQPIAGSCSSILVKLSGTRSGASAEKLSAISSQPSGNRAPQAELPHSELPHSELLDQFEITAELLRSRSERKPVQSTASFKSRAIWAG